MEKVTGSDRAQAANQRARLWKDADTSSTALNDDDGNISSGRTLEYTQREQSWRQKKKKK